MAGDKGGRRRGGGELNPLSLILLMRLESLIAAQAKCINASSFLPMNIS